MTYTARVVVTRPAFAELMTGGSYSLNVAGQTKATVAEAIASAVERAGVGAGTPRVAELERYVTDAAQTNAKLSKRVAELELNLKAMTEFRDDEAAERDRLAARVAELEAALRQRSPGATT
jgi:septal ring factor EnvC (AmiA/AmiB activator)